MSQDQVKLLVECVWDEMESMLSELELDPIAEVQLFGYFPRLKISTLFGTTFVQNKLPVNLLPLGPSILLVSDELPDEKIFYVYMVVRERLDGGLRLSYVFPYEDWTGVTSLKVEEIAVKDAMGRQQVIEIEKEIPSYARLWIEKE